MFCRGAQNKKQIASHSCWPANTMWREPLYYRSWIRDVFWPLHPRCRDPISNHTIKSGFCAILKTKRGAMLEFEVGWPEGYKANIFNTIQNIGHTTQVNLRLAGLFGKKQYIQHHTKHRAHDSRQFEVGWPFRPGSTSIYLTPYET